MGDLPWTWALLCGGSALVFWCLTRIPPLLLLIPHHPGLHTSREPPRALILCPPRLTIPALDISPAHVPTHWMRGSRERGMVASPSRTKVQHLSSSPGPKAVLEPVHGDTVAGTGPLSDFSFIPYPVCLDHPEDLLVCSWETSLQVLVPSQSVPHYYP